MSTSNAVTKDPSTGALVAVVKGRDGWKAESIVEFEGAKKLSIETHKYNGHLITRASVNTYTDYGFQHAFGLGGGGDFSERVLVTTERATEKTVAAQHAKVMQQLPQIIERAKAHYTKVAGARS